MPDLPVDVAAALAQLDGSIKSFDVLSGAVFRALARTNALGARLDRMDKAIEHVQRLDALMTAITRRLRALEAQPEPILADEPVPLRPLQLNRRGRPKGRRNNRTLAKLAANTAQSAV
jgi:hypothetical protein